MIVIENRRITGIYTGEIKARIQIMWGASQMKPQLQMGPRRIKKAVPAECNHRRLTNEQLLRAGF